MLVYMKIKTLVQNVFLKKTVWGPDCFTYDRLVMDIICNIFSLKFYLENKSKKMTNFASSIYILFGLGLLRMS